MKHFITLMKYCLTIFKVKALLLYLFAAVVSLRSSNIVLIIFISKTVYKYIINRILIDVVTYLYKCECLVLT